MTSDLSRLIEEWRRLAAANRDDLRPNAPSQAWELIYMDRADIYKRCADELSAILAASSGHTDQEVDTHADSSSCKSPTTSTQGSE